MKLRSYIVPAAWLVGVSAYFAGTIDWPWTIDGKRNAVVAARLSGDVARYREALGELQKLSPGLASLEQLEHPELAPGGKVDVVRSLKIALADAESAEAARYRQLELMLDAGPQQREKAIATLRDLARQEDPDAIELLADAGEDLAQKSSGEVRLARSFSTSATARRTLAILLANPQVAISRFQIRDVSALERRLIDKEAGDFQAPAMVLLADRLIRERPSPQSYEQALKLYREAMLRGSLRAKIRLALVLRDAPPPFRNVNQGVTLLKEAAVSGSTAAAYELGETYRLGKAGQRDIKLAVRYYQSAIERGSSGAVYRVGDLYLRGEGLPRDPQQAVSWFRIGSQRGNAGSKRALGLAYLEGVGVEQDTDRGIKLLEEAANAGDRASMSRLAVVSVSGRYFARDFVKAGNWALKAIAAGERNDRITVLAASSLAQTGNAANLARATDLLRAAIRRKDPLARRQLAQLLFSAGGARNEREALSLLEEGAIVQDPYSLAALGAIYATGNGVAIDPDKSLFYYTIAAQRGNPEGLRGLAIAYAAGFGVPQDINRAMQYYEKAASVGDRTALRSLASCALEACQGTRDVAKGQQYFERAAALGDTEALYQLATLQLQGAIPGGQAGAILRLKRAATLDHVASIKLLKRLGVDTAKVRTAGVDDITEEEAGA